MQIANVTTADIKANSFGSAMRESATSVLLSMFFAMQENMSSISAAANTIVNSIKDTNKKSSEAQAKANAVQDAINSLDPNKPSDIEPLPTKVVEYMRDSNIRVSTKDGDKTIDEFMESRSKSAKYLSDNKISEDKYKETMIDNPALRFAGISPLAIVFMPKKIIDPNAKLAKFNAAELKTVKAAIDRVVTDLTNQSSTTNLDSQRVSNALSQALQTCSQLLSIIKELASKTTQNM